MAQSAAKLFSKLISWVGFGLLALAAILFIINQSDVIDGEMAEGKTYEYVSLGDSEGTNRYPNIRFSAMDGKEYYFIDTTRTGMSRQQRRYDVIYDPADPSKAMVYNKIDIYGMPLIIGMTGLGALVFGVVVTRINKKREMEQFDV
jgi:hypothetical protein